MKKIALISFLLFGLFSCQTSNTLPELQDLNNDVQAQAKDSKEKSRFGTAKRDIFFAQSTARRWDTSAELVKIEGYWISETGDSNWVYYFKSPFKNTAYKVENMFGQEYPNSFFGSRFDEYNVRVDSDKAIQKAKTQGLKNFPVSRMTLENRFGRLEWEIQSSNGVFRISADF
ncbi:MAG: hypothetical protein U0457_19145 [Candidatus Sericytochromatia bacterium]